jgi:hypothetical protein
MEGIKFRGRAERCLSWVKLRRTQCEQMSSGLPLKADIAQCSRHVSNVPIGDIETNSACAKIAVSQLLESCLLQAQYGKRYCALRTVFPSVISGLRKPIAIQAAISFTMNLPE